MDVRVQFIKVPTYLNVNNSLPIQRRTYSEKSTYAPTA